MNGQVKNKRRFLVVVRAGDESLHKQWLYPRTFCNFDLYISYYGDHPKRYVQDCEYYSEAKGPRWPIYKDIVNGLGKSLQQYDAVWFPADDISTDAYTINQMFHIFDHLKLSLAQPALTRDSYRSWNITLQEKDSILRYTHFVEIMAPVFSIQALNICTPSFDSCPSGWGIDFVWPKLLGYPKDKIAVIDATPVRHTRPVGKGDLVRLQAGNGNVPSRKEQQQMVLNRHGIVIKDRYPGGIKALSAIRFPKLG